MARLAPSRLRAPRGLDHPKRYNQKTLKTLPMAVHRKQLVTYLRLADKRVGLLINFNVVRIKDGITRIVNRMPE